MIDFYRKSTYDQSDIENLIEIGAEENLHLEFKRKEALQKTDSYRKEISKDVSAFANAEGGILIYGISEENHKAKDYSFIDGNEITKEWIENVITGKIKRRIDNVIVIPIRFDNDIEKSIYLIKIPPSNNSPHMCANMKFYKKQNFRNTEMEEYEVRESYNRLIGSNLEIGELIIRVQSLQGTINKYKFVTNNISFQVSNIGNTIEKILKLQISVPEDIFRERGLSRTNKDPMLRHFVRKENNLKIFSVPNDAVIFPDEDYTVCDMDIRVDKGIFSDIENNKIFLRLYYSGGNEEKEINLKDKIVIDGDNTILTIDKFL
jgi:hypothetical protein